MGSRIVTEEDLIALDLILASMHYRAAEGGLKSLEGELARARTRIAAEKEKLFPGGVVGSAVKLLCEACGRPAGGAPLASCLRQTVSRSDLARSPEDLFPGCAARVE